MAVIVESIHFKRNEPTCVAVAATSALHLSLSLSLSLSACNDHLSERRMKTTITLDRIGSVRFVLSEPKSPLKTDGDATRLNLFLSLSIDLSCSLSHSHTHTLIKLKTYVVHPLACRYEYIYQAILVL
jgi:hypothetical protein